MYFNGISLHFCLHFATCVTLCETYFPSFRSFVNLLAKGSKMSNNMIKYSRSEKCGLDAWDARVGHFLESITQRTHETASHSASSTPAIVSSFRFDIYKIDLVWHIRPANARHDASPCGSARPAGPCARNRVGVSRAGRTLPE
jgi:hypothetical protein